MRIWLVPTKPEHLDACMTIHMHGTNSSHGKLMQDGDLILTYIVGDQNIVGLSSLDGDPFSGEVMNGLWSEDYKLVYRFRPIQRFAPIPISWKGLPGGSPCHRYGFTPPSLGPLELSPKQFAIVLEDIQAQER